MAISIRCENPDCRKPLRVKDELADKRVKCPGCGQHIMVPPPKPAPPSRDATEEPAPQVKPSAGHVKDPERPARRAVGLWLVGMAALLLVGAGGGYFLSLSQTKKGEDQAAQSDTKFQELARANADLTKQLAAAEQRAKEVSAANVAELNELRAQIQMVKAEAATANTELAKIRADRNPSPTPPATTWDKAFGIKLVITAKKAHFEGIDLAKVPKSDGLDYDKMLPKSRLAMAKGIGVSKLKKTPGEFGLVATLRIGRDDATSWPSDGKSIEDMHLWGQVLANDLLWRYNLLLSGTQTQDGVIRGKIRGSLAAGDHFQNADFEMRPIRDASDRD